MHQQLCRALIGIRGNYTAVFRYCDYAALNLQWITGKDFGFDFKQRIDDRNKAVAKVKTWLAGNPVSVTASPQIRYRFGIIMMLC